MPQAFLVDEDGVITNVIEPPSDGSTLPGMRYAPPGSVPMIGGRFEGGKILPPPEAPPTIPSRVTRRQLKLALLQLGLLDLVEAWVAGGDRATQIEWAEATEFLRDRPMWAAGAEALGKTPEDIDNLFVLAGTL